MTTVALVSLGCAKNLVDSEVMLGRLDEAGYEFTADKDSADIIVVNTCGFIQPARDEAEEAIRMALSAKVSGDRAITVAVVGCYVQRHRDRLEHMFPDVDIWTGVADFDRIADLLEGHSPLASRPTFLYDHSTPRRLATPAGWAYIKISEGCSHACGFCAIPMIKGPYRSRSSESIIAEAESLADRGILEINLVSQDSTYYGRDRGEKNGLSHLLAGLCDIRGLAWIRMLYGYPEEVDDGLLEVMTEPKVCAYLDIPFQHSHPDLVKAMGRGLSGPRAHRLMERIRKKLPGAAVRTSLIVGFPGEGDREFRHLTEFVREARFDHLGVFSYSPEPGTPSSSLGDPVPETVKTRRKEIIMKIQADISREINAGFLHRSLDVLFEGRLKEEPGILVGRCRRQAPEVDGLVFSESDLPASEIINTIRKVEITGTDVYDLYGNIVL